MAWRKRTMSVAESFNLQNYFGELQIALGGPPELAMFCSSVPGEDMTTVYITGPNIVAVEGEFPGVWENSDKPSGANVALLVGAGDPWELFNITKA